MKYSISKVPIDRIGLPSKNMCLHAMEQKMKDETNGNVKMGSRRVCDPISKISVTHVGDRELIPETSSSEKMILQRNNEVKRLRICDDYDDNGDYHKKNIGDSASEEPMQMAGITGISRTGISGKLLNGLKCTAKLKPTVHKRKSDSAPCKVQDSEKWKNGKGLTAAIRLTVEGLLQKQIEIRSKSGHDNTLLTVERIVDGKPKRLLTKSDFVQTQHLLESSELGSELLVSPYTISFPGTISNKISVTMAVRILLTFFNNYLIISFILFLGPFNDVSVCGCFAAYPKLPYKLVALR